MLGGILLLKSTVIDTSRAHHFIISIKQHLHHLLGGKQPGNTEYGLMKLSGQHVSCLLTQPMDKKRPGRGDCVHLINVSLIFSYGYSTSELN